MKRIVVEQEKRRISYRVRCRHCKTMFLFRRREFIEAGHNVVWMCPDCGRYHTIPNFMLKMHQYGGNIEVYHEEDV